MRVSIPEKMDIVCLVNAVNGGCIFRLLVKPCQPRELEGQSARPWIITAGARKCEVCIALPVHPAGPRPGEKLQAAHAVDISNSGARLAGLQVQLETCEVLNVECGGRKASFRVV
jgi:hypothetical protein